MRWISRRRHISRLIAVAACASSLCVVGRALAFKSLHANATSTPPTPAANFPFPGHGFGLTGVYGENSYDFTHSPPDSPNGGLRYLFHVIHEAHGGLAGYDFPSSILPGVYLCPNSARNGSLVGCVPLQSTDAQQETWPWLDPRRSWNTPSSEHWAITKAAAAVAGLPASLGKTFFVRYPSNNTFVASPSNASFGSLVLAQSQIPTGFESVSSEVLRGISVYEMSQVPDMSYSITDWISGNETCPLTDIDGAFITDNDPGQLGCHDYFQALGTLNVSHFSPGSRSVYEHYHQLALTRMDACVALNPLVSGYNHTGSWEPVSSANDTEAHECEREAMIYEMFAQHFLQDAWATGHMWHAWGYAQLSQYPALLEPMAGSPPDTTQPPAQNLPGRRALIAKAVAAYRAMVHGAKDGALRFMNSDAFKEMAKKYLSWNPRKDEILAGLAEDPLSYPYYSQNSLAVNLAGFANLTPVTWRNLTSIVAPGAGDQWANLLLNTPADPDDDLYAEPRKRLLMCTAASMREVYDRGPHAHGLPTAFSGAWDRQGFNFSDECWSQRATNVAMYGAIAPIRISYDRGMLPQEPAALFGIVNTKLLPNLQDGVQLPEPVDRENFKKRLTDRMTYDAIRATMSYAVNIIQGGENANQSAVGTAVHGLDDDRDITFLGVPPSGALTDNPPLPYLDVATPPVPESTNPQYYYMQHMFWRSHLKELCAQSNLLQPLHDRCVQGASQPGGDPDACTACVEIAEAHMPTAWYDEVVNDKVLGPSKCAMLGYPAGGGLPPAYRDYLQRVGDANHLPVLIDSNRVDHPSYYPAFSYCTGTDDDRISSAGTLSRAASLPPDVQHVEFIDCSKPPAPPQKPEEQSALVDYKQRIAVAINESSVGAPLGNWPPFAQLWVPPLITAFNDEFTTTLVSKAKFCSDDGDERLRAARVDRTTDPIAKNALGAAPFWDSLALGYSNLPEFDDQKSVNQLRFGVCGLGQRVSFSNRACNATLLGMNRTDLWPAIGQDYDAATGRLVLEISGGNGLTMCSVREPREIMQCAPGQGQCNADGLCTVVGAPTVKMFHDRPTP